MSENGVSDHFTTLRSKGLTRRKTEVIMKSKKYRNKDL